MAAQENPLFLHVFSKEDDLHSQFANLSMLINDFKSSAQGLAELIQKISEGCGNKTEIGQNEILLKTEMPQKLEQKPENDNVAVIKPEQVMV